MAIKFEKIKPGMMLYDRHAHKMGNTTLRTIGEWSVRILEVDATTRTAKVSWNGNPPETYRERALTRLYDWSMHDKCAEVTCGTFGRVSKVTKKKRTPAEPSSP